MSSKSFAQEWRRMVIQLLVITDQDIMCKTELLKQQYMEILGQKSYKIGYHKLKEKLLNALFTSFSSEVAPLGEYAEFEEMRLEDIFFLLYDIINDSEN